MTKLLLEPTIEERGNQLRNLIPERGDLSVHWSKPVAGDLHNCQFGSVLGSDQMIVQAPRTAIAEPPGSDPHAG